MEIIHIVSKFLREMLEDKLQAGAKSLFSFPLERPLHGCVLLLAGLNQRKGLCVLLQQKALNGHGQKQLLLSASVAICFSSCFFPMMLLMWLAVSSRSKKKSWQMREGRD